MEDKVFLDEAGLGEVGKVISKFYASKDDIKDLDSLKDFVGSHNKIKLHYITLEEYKEMQAKETIPYLSDIHDPISIVGIEPPADEYVPWDDDPLQTLYVMGLNVERLFNGDSQKYLLFNITPNHKIASDKMDNVDFNDSPLKDSDVRLQLAFGEKDQCLYWRLLIDSDDIVEWTYIQDPYSRQHVENNQKRIDDLIQQIEDKVSKSELPTKLSQLEEDETHRTVTDEEKETWNSKLDETSNLSNNDVVFQKWEFNNGSASRDLGFKSTLQDTLSDMSADIFTLQRNEYEREQNKDIKNMKEEITLLKSQIEKLQASVNNKE